MDLNITEIDNLEDDVEDVGFINAAAPTSRVPIQRITTMAHKNRGSLAPPVPPPQPARKVTYDDILSSLNMKVVDGKLQIVRNTVAENVRSNNFNPQQQQYQQQQQQKQQQTKFVPMQQQQFSSNQSKRFQSMHQPLQQEMQPTPILTKEQYRQVQIANYMKEVQRIQHIRNAKSTKLKFSNPNTNFNISPVVASANDLNRLFPLKGMGNR